MRVYGSGGWGFYATSGSGYTSPAWDNGTLTNAGGGGYTYTMPDGEVWNFNSSGYLTTKVSTDGEAVTTFTWNGSNDLSTVTTPDGALSTFTYSSGLLSSIATGSRGVSLSMSGSDLTTIDDGGVSSYSEAYSSHKLISNSVGGEVTTYAYTSGVLSGWTDGSGSAAGHYTLVPMLVPPMLGLVPKPAGASLPLASVTNPLGQTDVYALDSQSRVLDSWDPTGDRTQTPRNSGGYITAVVDPLGNTTSYTLDAYGYVTTQTNPDGTTEVSSYDVMTCTSRNSSGKRRENRILSIPEGSMISLIRNMSSHTVTRPIGGRTMLTKARQLRKRTGTSSSNVVRFGNVKLMAAMFLLLPIACHENKSNITAKPTGATSGQVEKTMQKEEVDRRLTLENACLALQRDLDIPKDSLLWKCLEKKELTFDKVSGYYSACGLLDFSLTERVFYINRGPVPKGAPDIKGSFYFTPEGKVKARRETP